VAGDCDIVAGENRLGHAMTLDWDHRNVALLGRAALRD
jgi:hypothetical protein